MRIPALLFLSILVPFHPALAESDIDTCTSRVIDYFTARGANPKDPLMADALQRLHKTVKGLLATMNEDGSWPDIDYDSHAQSAWSPLGHYQRLLQMAQAYRAEGQEYYQDEELLSAITKSLSFIQSRLSTGKDIKHWWYKEIGVPQRFGPTLILLRGQIDDALFRKSLTTLASFTASSQGAGTANNIDFALSQFYRFLLEDKARMITSMKVQGRFNRHGVIQPIGDGIQEDYSFHSHGPLLYIGGYGESFAEKVAMYGYFTNGTAYQPEPEKFANVVNFVAEGMLWTLYNQWFDPIVEGRSLTREKNDASSAWNAILLLANTDTPRKEDFIQAVKRHVQTKPELDLPQAGNATRASQTDLAAAWPEGHKHFHCSDLTVHRRQNFYVSVHMFSSRTICGDRANKEGNKLWNIYDGNTYIARSGAEYYTDNVLPTMNWLRLPGTTAEDRSDVLLSSWKRWYCNGFRSFVGGAGDGWNGVSAMDFADVNKPRKQGDPQAKKSWFFFDDEIVCLGTGVKCSRNNPLETIVNQRPLQQTNEPLHINGKPQPTTMGWSIRSEDIDWAWFDSIGYHFPKGGTIKADRTMQSGSWKSINGPGNTNTETYSNPFITLAIEHPTPITNGSYAYVVQMNTDLEHMAAAAADPDYEILEQSNAIHAVKHKELDALGAVFWQGGGVAGFRVDKPCIVYAVRNGNQYTIALSEPSHKDTTVTLVIDEALTPDTLAKGVTATPQGSQTRITWNVKLGRNYISTFTMAP